jgi:hypothetical protein
LKTKFNASEEIPPVMIALIELFCDVDDFLKAFLSESEKHQLVEEPVKKRRRAFTLSPAEIMVIVGHRLRNLLL